MILFYSPITLKNGNFFNKFINRIEDQEIKKIWLEHTGVKKKFLNFFIMKFPNKKTKNCRVLWNMVSLHLYF